MPQPSAPWREPDRAPEPATAADFRAPTPTQLVACAAEFERLQQENQVLSAELQRLRNDWSIEEEQIHWLRRPQPQEPPRSQPLDSDNCNGIRQKHNKIASRGNSREASPNPQPMFNAARFLDGSPATSVGRSPLQQKAAAAAAPGFSNLLGQQAINEEWHRLRSILRTDAEELVLKMERLMSDFLGGVLLNGGGSGGMGGGPGARGQVESSLVPTAHTFQDVRVPVAVVNGVSPDAGLSVSNGAAKAKSWVAGLSQQKEEKFDDADSSNAPENEDQTEKGKPDAGTQSLEVTIVRCTSLDELTEGVCVPSVTTRIAHKPDTEFRTPLYKDILQYRGGHTFTMMDYAAGDSLAFVIRTSPETTMEAMLEGHKISQPGGFEGDIEFTCASKACVEPPRLAVKISVVSEATADYKKCQSFIFPQARERIEQENLQLLKNVVGHWAEPILDWITWYETLEEPARTGRLANVLNSSTFVCICMMAVICNAAFIGYEADYQMTHLNSVGNESANQAQLAIEILFVMFYTAEICLKIAVHGKFFLLGKDLGWNIFDILIVLISAVVVFEESIGGDDRISSGTNVSFLRVWRMFKLARVLRIFKAFGSVSELRMMMDILVGCFPSLVWSIILLIFITYIFGLLFIQSATTFLQNEHNSVEDRELVMSAGLNTVADAMTTLYMVASGGMDWGDHYVKIFTIGRIWGIVYLFYIAFFNIAVWNVMTSIFIDRTMKLAKPDMDAMIFEKTRKAQADAEELLSLMQQMDSDHSGKVSFDEFLKFMDDDRFRYYFICRGLEIKDAVTFFKMLEVSCGGSHHQVDIVTLVKGLMHMRGSASSIDLHILHFECKQIHAQISNLQSDIARDREKLESLAKRPDLLPAQPLVPRPSPPKIHPVPPLNLKRAQAIMARHG